jgi:Flp pilus assembly protein protease CpaA
VLVPLWVVIATAAAFGCTAYLAMRAAEFVYANDAPLEDGPTPGRVHTLVVLPLAFAIGAISASRGADVISLAIVDVIVAALCAVVWTDVTRGFIGDWFSLPPLALVLGLALFRHDLGPVAVEAGVVTVPFALAAYLSKGRGMGWGDVKLVALGAALLDPQISILMYAIACMLACGIAAARRKRAEPIAFAPYLAGAIALGMILPPPSHFV